MISIENILWLVELFALYHSRFVSYDAWEAAHKHVEIAPLVEDIVCDVSKYYIKLKFHFIFIYFYFVCLI